MCLATPNATTKAKLPKPNGQDIPKEVQVLLAPCAPTPVCFDPPSLYVAGAMLGLKAHRKSKATRFLAKVLEPANNAAQDQSVRAHAGT